MIFALLNLARNAASAHQPSDVIPNYADPLLDVFANFVLHCCQYGSIDIICRPWALVPISKMPPIDRVDPTLQSYVPSWICSEKRLPCGTVSGLVNSRLNADILIGRYTAHGETRPQVRLGKDEIAGNHKGSLYCKAIVLGSTTRKSARMAEGVIMNEAVNFLTLGSSRQRWGKVPAGPRDTVIRSLCADHTAQVKPAPLYYCQAPIQIVQLKHQTNCFTKL